MRKHAFTLIELLIVVAIIAILAAIAVPNFLEAQVRSKVTRTKADMRTIAQAIEIYRMDNNEWPVDWDCGRYGGCYTDSEIRFFAHMTTPIAYLSTVPFDPFLDKGLFRRLGALDRDKEFPCFQINGFQKRESALRRQDWLDKNIWYSMTSPGPDIRDDFLWSYVGLPTQVNYLYDATNGTKSSGDLGWTNIGPIGG